MQGRNTLRPFVFQTDAVATNQIVARSTSIVRAYLEAGRKDNAVEAELFAVGDNTRLGDFVDAPAFCVDQMHVRAVKCW